MREKPHFEFILTSKSICLPNVKSSLVSIGNDFNIDFYSNTLSDKNNEISVFIDGYVLSKNGIYNEIGFLEQKEMIIVLYKKYGSSFIQYIKGMFCIIVLSRDGLELFTDQLGLYKIYYRKNGNSYAFSNSTSNLFDFAFEKKLDKGSLAIKSILHRVEPGYTIYKDVFSCLPASYIKLTKSEIVFKQYWSYSNLLELNHELDKTINIEDFADLLKSNFSNFIKSLQINSNAITLTGGKDSRTGLATLMNLGKYPVGYTYGNPESKDAIYAKNLAQYINIKHKVVTPSDSIDWFESMLAEIILLDNPDISIHRAHRYHTFKTVFNECQHPTAFYGGYLGGEFLMGIYFDNLIFPDTILNLWKEPNNEKILNERLNDYFNILDNPEIDKAHERIRALKSFNNQNTIQERQFHLLFELGIPHYSQDLFLCLKCGCFPYPFYIDIEFLELLFKSRYSFLHQNNQSKNIIKRHSLYKLNVELQHNLFPKMDTVPFAKQGDYSAKEYLRGPLYWSILKSIRYFMSKKKYPSSYIYTKEYYSYLTKCLTIIKEDPTSPISQVFNIEKALNTLQLEKFPATENHLHKYSNIVSTHFYLKNK